MFIKIPTSPIRHALTWFAFVTIQNNWSILAERNTMCLCLRVSKRNQPPSHCCLYFWICCCPHSLCVDARHSLVWLHMTVYVCQNSPLDNSCLTGTTWWNSLVETHKIITQRLPNQFEKPCTSDDPIRNQSCYPRKVYVSRFVISLEEWSFWGWLVCLIGWFVGYCFPGILPNSWYVTFICRLFLWEPYD